MGIALLAAYSSRASRLSTPRGGGTFPRSRMINFGQKFAWERLKHSAWNGANDQERSVIFKESSAKVYTLYHCLYIVIRIVVFAILGEDWLARNDEKGRDGRVTCVVYDSLAGEATAHGLS